MFHDFKYIIKRVLIGVLIALILSFLNGKLFLIASAKQISSTWSPFTGSNGNISTVNNLDTVVSFTSNTKAWANWGYGYLRFNFSIIKTSGSSTSPLVVPQNVNANNYVCDISSTSTNNSTFTGSTYSAICPMSMDANGFQNIYIFFTPNQQNEQAIYRITIGELLTFESVDVADYSTIINAINNNTSNDNSNTQSIIDSIVDSTQDIIDNQNQNSENTQNFIKEQLENCTDAKVVNPTFSAVQLGTSNHSLILNNNNSGALLDVSKYQGKSITISFSGLDSSKSPRTNYCFSSSLASNTSQSCLLYRITGSSNTSNTFNATVPNNAQYLYLVGYVNYVDSSWVSNVSISLPKVCTNKLNDINSSVNDVNKTVNDVNNTINNDNVDRASSNGGSFFNNFSANSHGLSGIITAPLRLLNAFTTQSCTPLSFQLPFVHNTVVLPCMRHILETNYGVFFSLWQLIITGLISYNVCLNIYKKVRDLQNPKNDRIEVLNL